MTLFLLCYGYLEAQDRNFQFGGFERELVIGLLIITVNVLSSLFKTFLEFLVGRATPQDLPKDSQKWKVSSLPPCPSVRSDVLVKSAVFFVSLWGGGGGSFQAHQNKGLLYLARVFTQFLTWKDSIFEAFYPQNLLFHKGGCWTQRGFGWHWKANVGKE